jgi:hypothetical protein
VTIDDVAVVIDSGRLKEKVYDPHVKLSYLKASWISQGDLGLSHSITQHNSNASKVFNRGMRAFCEYLIAAKKGDSLCSIVGVDVYDFVTSNCSIMEVYVKSVR